MSIAAGLLLLVFYDELVCGKMVALPASIKHCGGFGTLFRHIFKFSDKLYLSFCFLEQTGYELLVFIVLNDDELTAAYAHRAPKTVLKILWLFENVAVIGEDSWGVKVAANSENEHEVAGIVVFNLFE